MTAKPLTIGMATYRDFDGPWFTIQQCRLHLQTLGLLDEVEFVIVNNDPRWPGTKQLKEYCGKHVTYAECTVRGSCPPRQHLFEVATGDFVCCVDSHVLFENEESLGHLVAIAQAESMPEFGPYDILHGVMIGGGLGPSSAQHTHMRPEYRSKMSGRWRSDPRGHDPYGQPFQIPCHGLGQFMARRETFVGFHSQLRGFSGGECFLQEKAMNAGGKIWCHPGVRWMHKFISTGAKYNPTDSEKVRNHLLAMTEAGIDPQPMINHFVGGIGMRPEHSPMSHAEMSRIFHACGIERKIAVDPEPPEGEPDTRCLIQLSHSLPADKITVKERRSMVRSKRTKPPPVFVSVSEVKPLVCMGPLRWGSYVLRGAPVQKAMNAPGFNTRGRIGPKEMPWQAEVALVIKHHAPPHVRQNVKRIIWDPLDSWCDDRGRSREIPMPQYWAEQHKRFRFDEIIATSPACAEVMREGLPNSVRVHTIPHAHDKNVPAEGMYDPTGHISYCGEPCFIADICDELTQLAKSLDREFVADNSWRPLRGSALTITARAGNQAYPLNLHCRSGIKVANAAQAGIPVLASFDPSLQSLYTGADVMWMTGHLRNDLTAAMESPVFVQAKHSHSAWLETMTSLVGG